MLANIITRIVNLSLHHAWAVIAMSLLMVLASAAYVSTHFAINTDVTGLIDPHSEWVQRDAEISAAFPQRTDSTLAVVRAPAPELATQAANELGIRLRAQPALFRSVNLGAGSEFFKRNGLLFLPLADVNALGEQLSDARPLLNALAHDPSLRGMANLLSLTLLTPLQSGQVKLPDMARLLTRSADAVDGALAGRPAGLSWQALADTKQNTAGQSLIELRPVLNYNDLQPGAASASAIRQAAADLHLAQRYGATVALTGAIPLSDEEFSSVQEGAAVSGIVTVGSVLVLLWFALRSSKLVLAVFLTLMAGLVVTAALGLLLVGALNIISIAFAILFVGIAVDFGIQFGMRFRARHLNLQDTHAALLATARSIALPLTLAVTATTAGFLAFLPTDYRGVAELGEIAGVGILVVAFPSCVTLLPALIFVFGPSPGTTAPGYRWLGPLDRIFQANRKPLLYGTIALILAGLPLLTHLRFDSDPLHLKDPDSESMVTLQSLSGPDEVGLNNVQVLSASLAQAEALGARLERLPQVASVRSLASFVPDHQPAKLQSIAQSASRLLPVFQQRPAAPASDALRVSALRAAARALRNAALDFPGPGAAEASRLAVSLGALAGADSAARERAERALALPLKLALANLKQALQPSAITLTSLPPQIIRDWLAPDGRALLDVAPRLPATAARDDMQLRAFTQAVLSIAPNATGGPISVINSARVVIRAFIHAALLAVLLITLLLWAALRRFDDVLLTMVPLLVSGLVTLELCALLRIELNFANIIALPLLLGVGVAFKIYYVMAWRSGLTSLLQHGLTQAVILSAATTGAAFGSLWLSNHPGTASMGKLLVLALGCTLIGAVFFQPILMGTPRKNAVKST